MTNTITLLGTHIVGDTLLGTGLYFMQLHNSFERIIVWTARHWNFLDSHSEQ